MTDRLIPRPWFRANTRQSAMEFLISETARSSHREAPLAEGERALNWLVLPPFQRPPVWTEAQKVRFIESAWNALPLGVWVFNRAPNFDSPYDNWLLDGQQRVTAIIDYVDDRFPVFGHLWSQLTEIDRRVFKMIPFTSLETSLEDEAQLRDVYDRLAYGGTPHEPKASA